MQHVDHSERGLGDRRIDGVDTRAIDVWVDGGVAQRVQRGIARAHSGKD